jgi:hypothetical protein
VLNRCMAKAITGWSITPILQPVACLPAPQSVMVDSHRGDLIDSYLNSRAPS